MSDFRPLCPPPTPLTENQCEKRRVFSLAEKGGTPPQWAKITHFGSSRDS